MRLGGAPRILVGAMLSAIAGSACSPPARDYPARDSGTNVVDGGVDTAPLDAAPKCPEGPYGLHPGDTFPNLTLEGYRDGVGEWTKIQICDYYDPDGRRGVNAILVNASAAWCAPCNALATQFPGLEESYGWRGAHLVELLVDSATAGPADQKTIDAWQKKYSLPLDTVVDPDQEWLSHDTPDFGFPTQWYIDPRTMTVVERVVGDTKRSTIGAHLEPILEANGAPPAADGDAGTDAATD